MKKYTSFILIIALSLWAICSGFSNAHAGEEPVALSDMPLETVDAPFETPTDLVSFGDITEDRVINAKDALWVLKAAVCKCIIPLHQELIADVTRDGRIDAKDALEMLKYAVGKPNAIQPMEIKLQTIWPDSYTANTPEANLWKLGFATAEISYGIKTRVEGVDPSTAADTFVKAVMAGRVETDLMEVSLYTSRELAKKKVLANLSDSKTLNFNGYNSGVTRGMTFGKKRYGVSLPVYGAEVKGVIYNKELIKRYAPNVDIEELYRTKQWTFDTFRDLAKQCTVDTDGDGKTDIYGVTGNNQLISLAVASNGGGYAVMNNNRVEDAMFTSLGVTAAQWCKDLYKTDGSWRYLADLKLVTEQFAQGKAAMFVTRSYMIQQIGEQAHLEMGFVAMPIGPAQTDYVDPNDNGVVFIVPRTNEKRLSQVGTWLNALAVVSQPLVSLELEQMAESGLDAQGCKNYEALAHNGTPDYFYGAFSNTVENTVENIPISDERKLAVIHQSVQQELDDFYAPFYE